MSDRAAELAANVAAVRARIARACAAADRDAGGVTLVAVTKFFPAEDAVLLAELGLADLGESRAQEAVAKASRVDRLTSTPVRWHFLGQLQTNKAASVAGFADLVHSVDRPAVVAALDRGAARAGRLLPVLIQLSLDGDPGRGGVASEQVMSLADTVADHSQLRLAGVMAVAPASSVPDEAFARLGAVAGRLRERYPGADVVSAGMSGDLEAAVAHGATHVRIGTALLGRRSGTFG